MMITLHPSRQMPAAWRFRLPPGAPARYLKEAAGYSVVMVSELERVRRTTGMNERQRQRFEKPPVSLPLCYVIEFLICHALLVMIAVLSLFFAAQLGVFHLTPVQSDAGVIGAWTMGRILSAAMLEGVILFISLRYAGNQVHMYERVMADARSRMLGPEADLPTVHIAPAPGSAHAPGSIQTSGTTSAHATPVAAGVGVGK